MSELVALRLEMYHWPMSMEVQLTDLEQQLANYGKQAKSILQPICEWH